jgi:hypothetical protein
MQVVGDLQDRHRLSIPNEVVLKKEEALDILVIFTNKKTVKFVNADHTIDNMKGRWCSLCR